jgi:hypothetical protein
MLIVFLFNVVVDAAVESADDILNKRGDEPRFVVSSRERNACKRYQCGLSSITLTSRNLKQKSINHKKKHNKDDE